jgi:hypothetical protein
MQWPVLIKKVFRKWKCMQLHLQLSNWSSNQSAWFSVKSKLGQMQKLKFSVVWTFWTFSVSSKLHPWLKNKSKSLKNLTSATKTSSLKRSQVSLLLQKVCAFGSAQSKPCSECKKKSNPRSLNSKEQRNHSKWSKVSWPLNKNRWNKFKTKWLLFREIMKTHWENHNLCNNKSKLPPFNLWEPKNWSEVWQVKLKDGKLT